MSKRRSSSGWIVIGVGVSAVLCLIGIALIRVVIQNQYGIELFSTPRIDERTCYAIFVPVALGLVWFVYRLTFIRSTYTDRERRALKQQLMAITASVILLFLGIAFRQTYALIVAGILWGFAGLNSIVNRIGVILRHPLLFEAHNRGWSAVATGLIEIAVGVCILLFSIRVFA